MAAMARTVDQLTVDQLLGELAGSGRVQFSVLSGDGFLTARLMVPPGEGPQHGPAMEFWEMETVHWILWLRSGAVSRVLFVREPDPHAPGRQMLSLRFIGSGGPTYLRALVKPLYQEDGTLREDQVAFWEELRGRYGGRDEVPVKHGVIGPG